MAKASVDAITNVTNINICSSSLHANCVANGAEGLFDGFHTIAPLAADLEELCV